MVKTNCHLSSRYNLVGGETRHLKKGKVKKSSKSSTGGSSNGDDVLTDTNSTAMSSTSPSPAISLHSSESKKKKSGKKSKKKSKKDKKSKGKGGKNSKKSSSDDASIEPTASPGTNGTDVDTETTSPTPLSDSSGNSTLAPSAETSSEKSKKSKKKSKKGKGKKGSKKSRSKKGKGKGDQSQEDPPTTTASPSAIGAATKATSGSSTPAPSTKSPPTTKRSYDEPGRRPTAVSSSSEASSPSKPRSPSAITMTSTPNVELPTDLPTTIMLKANAATDTPSVITGTVAPSLSATAVLQRVTLPPFKVSFALSGGATTSVTTEHMLEVVELTLTYIHDFYSLTFELLPSSLYDSLEGTRTGYAPDFSSMDFAATARFLPNDQTTRVLPTATDLDTLLVSAFQLPAVETMLIMLQNLPMDNPYCKTTLVSYNAITATNNEVNGGDKSNSFGAIVGVASAVLVACLVTGAVATYRWSGGRRGNKSKRGGKRKRDYKKAPSSPGSTNDKVARVLFTCSSSSSLESCSTHERSNLGNSNGYRSRILDDDVEEISFYQSDDGPKLQDPLFQASPLQHKKTAT